MGTNADSVGDCSIARALLRQTTTGVGIIALDGRYLATNRALRELLDRSEEELTGLTWRDVTHPDDVGPGDRLVERVLGGHEQEHHIEKRYRRPDGEVRWVMVGTSLVLDDDGEATAYLSQAVDITDRKAAEEALRASEQRLREVQALAGLGSWRWDVVTGEVTWSEQIFRLLGRDPDSVAPSLEWFMAHVHPDDRAHLAGHLEHTLATSDPLHAVFRLACADGQTRTVLGGGEVVEHDGDGEPRRLSGYLLDVTARAEAQAALGRSEERMHLILETGTDAFVQYDRDRVVHEWNRAAETLLGWGREDALGARVEDLLVPPGDAGAELHEVLTSLESPALEGAVEAVARHRDGGLVAVEVTIPPTPDDVLRSAFIRDIGERKQAETALQETNTTLRRTVAALERRGRDAALLAEMIDLLQSATEASEGYRVIERFASELFPDSAGTAYVRDETALHAAASWGGHQPLERTLELDDCWALRRGRPHWAEPGAAPLYCPHTRNERDATVCVPMIVQDEVIGLVSARMHADPDDGGGEGLVVTDFAERTALALANIRLRERLRAESIRDPLTGVFNRRYLEETFERELSRARRNGYPLGVAMVDLDRFKQFNDRFGHPSGDAALQAFARYLQGHVRADDVVCRYGGEEFVLLFPEADAKRTRERCESLRVGVAGLALAPSTTWDSTVSFGVAAFPDHGQDSAGLLRAADTALYRAKRAGRDRVVVSEAA